MKIWRDKVETYMILNFSKYSQNIVDIVKVFQKIGWNIYSPQGNIEYLPVGDQDDYNWQSKRMTESEFYDILVEKIAYKEQIGVNLFYHNGVEGITLLADDTNEIMLELELNRKRINERHTDTIWYLKNIVYKLFENGIELLSYSLEEYED